MKKNILMLISGIVIFAGLLGAAYLVRNQQETRRSAAGDGQFFWLLSQSSNSREVPVNFRVDLFLMPDKETSAFDVSIPVHCRYVEVVKTYELSGVDWDMPFPDSACKDKDTGIEHIRGVARIEDSGTAKGWSETPILSIDMVLKEDINSSVAVIGGSDWLGYGVGPDSDTVYDFSGHTTAFYVFGVLEPTTTPSIDTSCAVVSATCSSTTSDSITYQITYDDDQKQYWDGLVVGNSPTDIRYQEELWPETYTLEGLDENSSYSYKFGCHKFYEGVGTSLSWQTAVNDVIPADGCPGTVTLPTLTPMPTVPAIGGLPSCTISGPNAVYLPGQQSNAYRANFDYDGDLSSLGLDYQWNLYGDGCGSFIDESDLRVVWLAPDENASCRLAMSATRTVSGVEQQIVCTKDVSVFAAPLTPNPTSTTNPSSCPRGSEGDLNCDGRINVIDMSILLEAWVYSIRNNNAVPTPGAGRPSANLDGQDGVDVSDAQIVLNNWDIISD